MSALRNFAKRLLNPEDLGWAVSQEVREAARAALLDGTGDSARVRLQSRRMSLLETCASVVVGFGVSVAITAVLLPAMGHAVSLGDNLLMTGVFTVASIARGYWLRRLFNWLEGRYK